MSIDQDTGVPQTETFAWPGEERWASSPGSVRALIAELAQIEDAVRRTPTFIPPTDGPAAVNPALLELLAREGRVVRALRSYRAGAVWQPVTEPMAARDREEDRSP